MKIIINALHRATRPTGVCRYAFNLAIDLSSLSNVREVILVVGKWQADYFYSSFEVTSNKIKIMPVTIRNNAISRNLWFLFSLPSLVKKIRGDLLHLSFPIPVFGSWINIPTYVTVHDLYPFEIPENFGFPRVYFNRLFLFMSVKSIKNIICVSHTTKKLLIHYFPKECKNKKISVIYNSVKFSNVKKLKPRFLSDYKYSSLFLCNSQHRRNKNIPLIFESFSQLLLSREIDSKTLLIIIGSKGPETNKLTNSLWNRRINENVVFVDSITDSELAWLYENCELFIAASSCEGFCIPLAEAMLFSAKVVCSNIPIFHEIGGEGCTYFNLSNDASYNLTQAIKQALIQKKGSKNKNLDIFTGSSKKYKDLYTKYKYGDSSFTKEESFTTRFL